MSVAWNSLDPMVDITMENGERRRLLLETIEGRAVEIAEQPDEGFPPPITIGPPEQNSDIRTRKVIWKDWRRGMGRDEYEETQGLTEFRDSSCDTRFPNVLVCRQLPVRVGSNIIAFAPLTQRSKGLYLGLGNIKWAVWDQVNIYTYNTATNLWSASAIGNTKDLLRADGRIFTISNGFTNISASTDGTTWTTLASTGKPTGVDHYGLAHLDGKLFTLVVSGGNTYTLYSSSDASSSPASASWAMLGRFVAEPGEELRELFVWKFPPQPDRPGLFALTNHRILFYDDTADAASVTAWKTWHRWDQPYGNNNVGHLRVWGRTGDLYVMPSFAQDKIWQFTGSTITPHSPNGRGGLPAARQGAIFYTDANSNALVCWVRGNGVVGGTNPGMVVAMNEQDGWHHILDTDDTSLLGAGVTVQGGVVGPTSVLTVMSDGKIWEQPFPDTTELPQYATTPRVYDPFPLYHQTAKTDVGTPTLRKAALYVEINASIPVGATIGVFYRTENATGVGTGFTPMLDFTNASAMPARVAFPANITFRQIELKFVLTRGTATNATPILYSAILHTTLIVPARWVYQLRVDGMRVEKRAQRVPGRVAGYGLTNNRSWIRGLHGQIVSFTVAHPGDEISVARAQVTVTPIEGPLGEGGRYLLQFRELTTPLSGV